ncbi:MAG: esterase-like activity of phytase family protein, partial [Bacteroidales bacterium]|nr:esterase-like activity of phytase family protein [Bacteroidales bacterium]
MSTDGEPLEAVLMLPEQDLTGSDVVVILITAENIENKYGNIVEGPVYYSSKIAGEKLEPGGVYIWETQPVRMEDLDNNLNITPLYQTNITSQVGSGEYSGITYISGNQYAVVHDKLNGGGLTLFDIPLYPDGSVGRITKSVPAGTSGSTISSRDNEGVAYVNGKLFISAEADQSIREYTLKGKETGRALDVPSDLKSDKIQGNAGFEALTYNAKTERFWTVTEKPLLADEETFLGLLRLQSFGKNLKPAGRALYLMDTPNKSENEVSGAYAYVHGVPALAALDDGRLIVLEREVYVPNGNVLIK